MALAKYAGIVFAILLLVVSVLAVYQNSLLTSKDSEILSLQQSLKDSSNSGSAEIASLNQQIDDLKQQISSLQSELNSTKDGYDSQIAQLNEAYSVLENKYNQLFQYVNDTKADTFLGVGIENWNVTYRDDMFYGRDFTLTVDVINLYETANVTIRVWGDTGNLHELTQTVYTGRHTLADAWHDGSRNIYDKIQVISVQR